MNGVILSLSTHVRCSIIVIALTIILDNFINWAMIELHKNPKKFIVSIDYYAPKIVLLTWKNRVLIN